MSNGHTLASVVNPAFFIIFKSMMVGGSSCNRSALVGSLLQILRRRLSRHENWILAKFFYPEEYLGFESNLESTLELLAFSALTVTIVLPIYSFVFKQNSVQVKDNMPRIADPSFRHHENVPSHYKNVLYHEEVLTALVPVPREKS